MSMSITELETKTVIELRDIARELELAGIHRAQEA